MYAGDTLCGTVLHKVNIRVYYVYCNGVLTDNVTIRSAPQHELALCEVQVMTTQQPGLYCCIQ